MLWYLKKNQPINVEKLDKAKSIVNDIIAKNPYFVRAYQNYYEILSLSNDYKEQINLLNKYVSSVVSNNLIADQELVYLLGVAYQNNKQYEEAMNIYNKLLETFPNYTNVYFKLGELYELEDKNDLALQNYQRVLELDPNASIVKDRIEKLK